ncbi:glycosyltransferase family 2 protein [Halobium palmae]|uniref:Glycosyltransferase family 2 protein n=1 Tax=Halobium palmae TaxID=1776492 RepID=A0ABD5S1A2_9EURY
MFGGNPLPIPIPLPPSTGGLPLQTVGLDSRTFTLFLVGLSILLFLWGFERYRTSFSKREFYVAIALSLGVFLAGTFPVVYGSLGAILRIERRSLVVSVLANTALVALVLYLFAQVRNNQLSIAGLTRSLTVEQATDIADADGPTAFVVIPAYNEAGSIRDVVRSVPESVHGYDVRTLVVSDGSTDETARVVEGTAASIVEHPRNQGQGGALKTGFEIARQHGADAVVTMDADGQHPADQLDRLLAPIHADEADYVVGSRYTGVDNSGNGLTRQSGIRAFTKIINVMTKADITDCTNGFRAIRGSKLDELTLTEERFSAPELIIEARKNGLRIREIPVSIAERETGTTKKPKLGYAFGLFRTILMTWAR